MLSGPLGPQTVQHGEGSRRLFDAVNASGSVHGRKISCVTLDDGFDPHVFHVRACCANGSERVLSQLKQTGANRVAFFTRTMGWARLLVEGLKRTGRDLNTASFIKAMEGAGEIAFGRFTAQFSPKSHNGSSCVELAIVDADGRLRY